MHKANMPRSTLHSPPKESPSNHGDKDMKRAGVSVSVKCENRRASELVHQHRRTDVCVPISSPPAAQELLTRTDARAVFSARRVRFRCFAKGLPCKIHSRRCTKRQVCSPCSCIDSRGLNVSSLTNALAKRVEAQRSSKSTHAHNTKII